MRPIGIPVSRLLEYVGQHITRASECTIVANRRCCPPPVETWTSVHRENDLHIANTIRPAVKFVPAIRKFGTRFIWPSERHPMTVDNSSEQSYELLYASLGDSEFIVATSLWTISLVGAHWTWRMVIGGNISVSQSNLFFSSCQPTLCQFSPSARKW